MNFSSLNLVATPGQLGIKPDVRKPNPAFLTELGEEGFRELIASHYDLLKDSDISQLFPTEDPQEFSDAKKHAADFMIQICGGPAYFNASRGAPMMGKRHAPFRIDEHARQRWLECYAMLLPALAPKVSNDNIQSYWNYLNVFSQWMVNTPS
ncbi:globin [Sulfurimonas sp. MAG313]|nr:globin [Sulfurimonas sp. MAG313]MDF1881427.1 globin [Sulfurimonas sp. MAG313]